MRSEWSTTILGNVVELKRGYDLPAQDRRPGNVPIVTSSGVGDFHAEAKVKGPGVVTGRYGTIGQVYYIQEDFWPHNTTLYVRDFKGNDPRFVSYFLRTIQYLSYSDKAAVPGVNRNHLHQAVVTVPPLPEQRAIAAVLGSLDDKTELNRRMNATLEETARALFKSWFVDFDPVRAKMEGRETGLPEEIDALFPGEMEDGRPRGWGEGTVDDEFNLTMGQSPPGNTYNADGEGLPFYQGKTDFGFRFPTRRMYCTAPTRFGNEGDTLVSVRAPVGTINLANEPCCIGRGVAAIRHKSGSRSFTYYMMESLKPTFDSFEAEGTVFGSINKKDFHSLSIVKVPQSIIHAFEKLAFPLDQAIEINEQEAKTLAALRDALLPKLMRGEVRVSVAEQAVADAL